MRQKFFIILWTVFCFGQAGIVEAYYNPGTPTGFVNDYTSTLSTAEEEQLENKLSGFEKETGHEISIVIINNLDGDTIENFAVELFTEWGIGKRNADNGVLILVAKEDREMRIEVGYGLEGALTDAQAYWIISQVLTPAFQQNDFFAGLNEASNKIIDASQGEEIPSLEKNDDPGDAELFLWIFFFGFSWLISILSSSKSWWLGGIIGAVIGIVLGFMRGFMYFGFIALVILIPLGLLIDFVVSKQHKPGTTRRGRGPWWGGGGGSSSGGFGGFGGGMSGGGGSSGRW